MSRWSVARITTAVALIGIGAAALFRFDLFQMWLVGLSGDGVVQPHTWLALRIMLIGCAGAGITLIFWNAITTALVRIGDALMRLSEYAYTIRLIASAVVLRIAAVALLPFHLFADATRYDELAQTWASTGSYLFDGHSTAFSPPGYPFFLSRLYLIFGHAPLAGVIANVALSLGIVYLTYRLARVSLGERPARLAGIIIAVFPSQLLFVNQLLSEILFTFLFLLGLVLWLETYHMAEKRRGTMIVWSGVAGIALGLATQVRTIALLAPVVVLMACTGRGRMNRRLLARWAAMVAGMLLVLSPWVVRNSRVIGRATLATNSGVNFYIGNNPNSAMGCAQAEQDLFHEYGEATADRLGYQLGVEYIVSHPTGFVKRAILKAGYLMGSDTEGMWYRIILAAQRGAFDRYAWIAVITQGVYLSLLLFFAAGVVTFVRNLRTLTPGARIYIYLIVYWICVHAVVFGDGRFRFPIMPLMIGLASMGIPSIVDPRSTITDM